MAKAKRGSSYKVHFEPIGQRPHIHYDLDMTNEGFELPEHFPEAQDAIVKISAKYLSSEEGQANEILNELLKKLRPIARYIRIPERSAIQTRNRKIQNLNSQLTPYEAFLAYLEGRTLPSSILKEKLIAKFNEGLEEIPEITRNMTRITFSAPKIDRVYIRNFMPFRGYYNIDNLPEGLIGVVGQYQDQDGRSNRAGKSSFLDAILFTLVAEYRNVSVKHLIHQGKEQAETELDVSWNGGTAKFRKIISPGPTSGIVKTMLDGNQTKTSEAEIEFKRIFGMEKKDFLKTCYVRQGDLEAVFEQGATKLREDIVRWKNLQIWDYLEDVFHRKIRELTDKETGANTVLKQAQEEYTVPIPSDKEIAELRADLETNRIVRDEMIRLRQEVSGLEKQERILKKFDVLEENAKKEVKLKARLKTILVEREKLEEVVGILSGKISVLENKINDLLIIGKQGFNGKCPIVGRDCPAKKMVDENLEFTKNAIYTARAEKEKIQLEYRDKKMSLLNLQEEVNDSKIELGAIERLREEYKKWGGPTQKEIHKELLAKQNKLAGMSHNYERLVEHWERMQLDIANHKRIKANIEKYTQILKDIAEEKRYLIWLKLATGKSGIPFQLVEDSLEDIENQVNQILKELGADPRIHFESEKENRRYEAVCSYCQFSYPKGQGSQASVCPICSSPRQLEFKAEIRPMVVDGTRTQSLHMDSGGGRALIALATRIAISRFLGASILFLDEVTGALDSYHLQLIIRLLHRLPSLGFRQVFIISHQKEVDDSIPFRIYIRRLLRQQYSLIER